MLRPNDPARMPRHNVEHDKWDLQDLEAVMKELRSFADSRDKLCEVATETGGALSDDAYFLLLKYAYEFAQENDIRPTHRINRFVEDEMIKLPKYAELRAMGTVGDEISSALAFEVLEGHLEEIMDRLQKAMEKAQQIEQKMREQWEKEQEKRSVEDMLQDLDNPDEALEKRLQELKDQIESLGGDAEQLKQQLEQELEDQAPGIRNQLNQGLGKASEDLKNEQAAAQLFGTDPGELRRMPADKRLEMARALKNRPNLAKLADLVGPMRRLAFTAQRRRVDYAVDEVYEIELGDDLSRILPDELIRLHKPQTRRAFLVDYSEKKLQQFRLRGEEEVGKGDIIYCADSSGSMMGDREVYSKAVGLVLADMAKAQKRGFRGVIFGSASEISIHDFPTPQDFTFEKLLDFAEFSFMGGTDFQAPLTVALEHLQKQHDATGKVNADIVFATDGWCSVSEEFLKHFKAEQERLRFQVFGVVIGSSPDSEPLNTICDGKVIGLQDLASGEPLVSIFGGLNKKF
jgi:uncharacterized protein with von Willebrand factor type A (vWA) domain